MKYFLAGHKKLLFLGPNIWLGPLSAIIGLFIVLFIQSAFTYAIPAVIGGGDTLVRALIKSVILFKNYFFTTLLLVGLPMLIYVPLLVLNYNSVFLIDRFFPEIILCLAVVGVIVNSLVVDPLITLATAELYSKVTQKS
jgi:hypothetical protein